MDYAQHTQLEFRRRFWVVVGAKIEVIDPASDKKVGFIKMKAWKLREDVRLYTDDSLQAELLRIHARNIIDFGNTYDVFESNGDQPAFSLRRKGLKSTFVRDHWDISDPASAIIGNVQETSSSLALVRRWIGLIPIVGPITELVLAFVPQTYNITIGDQLAATITHRKNPFIVKMGLDMSMAPKGTDNRISIASTTLLSIMDAAKNS